MGAVSFRPTTGRNTQPVARQSIKTHSHIQHMPVLELIQRFILAADTLKNECGVKFTRYRVNAFKLIRFHG